MDHKQAVAHILGALGGLALDVPVAALGRGVPAKRVAEATRCVDMAESCLRAGDITGALVAVDHAVPLAVDLGPLIVAELLAVQTALECLDDEEPTVPVARMAICASADMDRAIVDMDALVEWVP